VILRQYTTADLATLRGYATALTTARFELLSGKRVTSVSYDGKSVSYSQSDMAGLLAALTDVNDTIAWLTGQAVPRGPIHFTF
jgi:hypothetical protein